MKDLKEKKLNVLLMMPTFYHLSKIVEGELSNKGFNVTFIESKILKEDYQLLKTVTSFFFFLFNPFYKIKYTRKIINKVKKNKFDVLFTIGYMSTNKSFFRYLKNENPQIKTILYLWDSLSAWNFKYLLDHFDYKYSFDRSDCKVFKSKGLVYFPLFYSIPKIYNNSTKYDLSHVGTINKFYGDRIRILDNVINQSKKLGLNIYIRATAHALNSSFFKKKKLLTRLRDWFLYLFDPKYRKHIDAIRKHKEKGFIYNNGIEQELFDQIQRQSKCLLDINVDNNKGVSHRTIRAIAMGKKVITTNKYILEEEFYNPNMISILDRNNPKIDVDFLNSPYEKVDISYLRIDNWISKIFKDAGIYR